MVIGADCHNVEGNQSEVGANLHKTAQIRIGPDRAYPLHFTHPQLLLLPVLLPVLKLGWNLFLLVFWALSFEMITFQPLIDI